MQPTSRALSLAAAPAPSLVAELQRRSGLSQAELARRAGLPRSVVNAYLHGHRAPGSDTLLRLVAAAGFKLELTPRKPPVDVERASHTLVQVLELAEALPFRPKPDLCYPNLPERIARTKNL